MILVTADCQTKGRGRRGKEWAALPKKSLLASYCFFVPKKGNFFSNITQIMAISSAKALEQIGFYPKLKWPNDILLSRKKVGGILCESLAIEEQIAIIVGIGLNLTMDKEDLEAIDQPATSLLLEGRVYVNVENLLLKVTKFFRKDVKVYLKWGFEAFLTDYSARLAHGRGQPLVLKEKDVYWKGVFQSINTDGSLNLLLPTGQIKRFYNGELSYGNGRNG